MTYPACISKKDIYLSRRIINRTQVDKTKAVKKFVLSVSFLLSLTLVAGVNITEIHLFGVEVLPEMEYMFLGSILFIHLATFAYFIFLRGNDIELHSAMISRVKKATESYLDFSKKLDEIVLNYELPSVEELLDDFRENATVMNPNDEDIVAYQALKFYEKELKNTHRGFEWIEQLEILAVWGLYITGLIALILSF
ncbi:MAG: hypothetical protein WD028_05240 [Balneolaceae bacterium]